MTRILEKVSEVTIRVTPISSNSLAFGSGRGFKEHSMLTATQISDRHSNPLATQIIVAKPQYSVGRPV